MLHWVTASEVSKQKSHNSRFYTRPTTKNHYKQRSFREKMINCEYFCKPCNVIIYQSFLSWPWKNHSYSTVSLRGSDRLSVMLWVLLRAHDEENSDSQFVINPCGRNTRTHRHKNWAEQWIYIYTSESSHVKRHSLASIFIWMYSFYTLCRFL